MGKPTGAFTHNKRYVHSTGIGNHQRSLSEQSHAVSVRLLLKFERDKEQHKKQEGNEHPRLYRREDSTWHLSYEGKAQTVTSRESLNNQCAFSVPTPLPIQKNTNSQVPTMAGHHRQCRTHSQGRTILASSLQVDVNFTLLSCASFLSGGGAGMVFLEPTFPWCR